MRRSAFSTGFIFKYEGSDDSEMIVKPVHQSLKDEILESGHVSASEWMQCVDLKARKYMNTNRVKNMVTTTYFFNDYQYTPVTKEHIYAIILYCDFSELCTAFSTTFRRQNVFETIESVKQRHAKFATFGRLLVELVLEFGINGDHRNDEYETGPFFCGLNCILNIGSFAISLEGPCSTTTSREVAINFAKSDGIILKLINDTFEASRQNFFDCSWISNYFEEAERLWIAGESALRIVSIVIVRSAKNYRKTMRAMFLFDAMISGVWLTDSSAQEIKGFVREQPNWGNAPVPEVDGDESGGCKIKPEDADYELLTNLIDSELRGDVDAITGFDEYLKKEWRLFLQSKQQIILNWYLIRHDFQNISDIVAFDLKGCAYNEDVLENVNLLKAEWISIFPAVHTVIIDTYYFRH